MFSDAYSGAKDPLTLAAFLHAWWLNAECHQASYQQQDAHEFYLNALLGLGDSDASAPWQACADGMPLLVRFLGLVSQVPSSALSVCEVTSLELQHPGHRHPLQKIRTVCC